MTGLWWNTSMLVLILTFTPNWKKSEFYGLKMAQTNICFFNISYEKAEPMWRGKPPLVAFPVFQSVLHSLFQNTDWFIMDAAERVQHFAESVSFVCWLSTVGCSWHYTCVSKIRKSLLLTIHLILPLTVDFYHNITQYQFNTIQSSLALKRKREGEREREIVLI